MLNNSLIVFPTSRAIRGYIDFQKSSNQFLSKTITIGDFFSKIIINQKKTLINKDLRILYLKKAIDNIGLEKLGLSKNFSKFYNQSEYIFKFFNELNSEFKTIEDINSSDTYAFYMEHLDILQSIYESYTNILDENNYIDSSILPKDYEINIEYLKEYDNIIINYEGYFSSFEFKVICQASEYVKLNINLTLNQFNTKNIDMFKKIGLDLEKNNIYEIDLSNKQIVNKQSYKKELNNHIIYPVKQRITQISFIKYAIVNMVKSKISANNIVVVLPDEKFASYLKLFDNENYFNFAMGNDIYSSTSFKKASAIAEFLNNDEPKYKENISFLEINKDYLEQLKSIWNNSLQKESFFRLIDYIIEDEVSKDIIEKVNDIKLSIDNLFFNSNIQEELNNELKLKDAYKIFFSKLSKITVDDTRSGKVTVLGILETRNISFDGVIVIDFNDDKIPKRSIKDKFLSSKVKEHTNLPSLKDRENLQKYYYKSLFDKAKQISISYLDDDSNTISRFSSELFIKLNINKVDFSSILQTKVDLNIFDKQIMLDIDLSTKQWSATSLKTYMECRRKYYFNYILKIKEHSISLKPKAYEVGLIIHNVLDDMYNKSILSYKYLCDNISKYQNKNPYLSLELEVYKRKLKKFIQNEKTRFETENIKVYKLEEPFELNYNGISIKGTIDRIDKLQDNTYCILDYKTSSSLKIDTLKTYEKSVDFQLEFYYLASRAINVSKVAYYDLNDASIKEEIVLQEKIKRLDDIFKSLKTKTVDFYKCEDKKACTFCIYKTICGED